MEINKNQKTIELIQKLVPESIGEDLYRCNRVWEAWQMNTMSEDDFEIISQPITLAVVLEAIREANVGFVFVTHCGMLHKKVGIEDTAHTYLGIWNLSKDNFNDQSEETKTFIGGLLGNSSQED